MKRIIENLAEILTKDHKEEKEVVTYGLTMAMEIFLNILTTIIIAVLFGMIVETMMFSISFFLLRSYSGGIHARNGMECYFYSTLMIVVVLSLQKFEIWGAEFNNLAICTGVLVILAIAPIGDKNKPLDRVEKKRYRKKVYQILFIIVLVYAISSVFVVEKITTAISIAILVISVSLILGKIKNSFSEKGFLI
ncbi:MAG: accessory gene regulator B family protein [Eubacteriales bacterium]